MYQLSLPSHTLGTIQGWTAHYKVSAQQKFFSTARSLWATIHARRYIIAVFSALTIFMSPTLTPLLQSPVANASQTNSTTIITRSDAETYYLQAVNQLRATRGLAPMIVDSRLSASAMQKSNDMVLQNYWAHYAPNGTSFSDYIWRMSPKAEQVGENLARCFDSRQAAFDALVASPTHYAVMTGRFTNFGVAEVQDTVSGCTYTTMHFAEYTTQQ